MDEHPLISLRPVTARDARELFPLVYQTRVPNTLAWDGPLSLEEYQNGYAAREVQMRRGEIHLFTILEAASGHPVGAIDIRPENQPGRADIGLWIGEPYQGKGYGTQAVSQIIDYGFQQLGLDKVEACIFTGNWASRRIFEKNGFILERTIRNAVLKQGRWLDEWLVGINREDYFIRGRWIVHLCPRMDWEMAQEQGSYRAPSLSSEGFIHLSRPGQLLEVANRFYQNVPDLVILWVDPLRLKAELHWEAVENQDYPHLYGPINVEAVFSALPFLADADGTYRALPYSAWCRANQEENLP
jgi:RimJ/RimL family protein N-acetyltransferase